MSDPESDFGERLGVFPELLPALSEAEAGWTIEARWHRENWSDGPWEVRFVLAPDADEATRQRGLTTGIMRRLESHLTELILEHRGMGDREDYEAEAQSLMGLGPRDADDYYVRLLRLYLAARRLGTQPINRLARDLGVPKGTVTTRLDVAKRRHAEVVLEERADQIARGER